MAGNLIEAVFHLRGEVVVHQFAEVGFQAVSDDLTHFFRIETTVFNTNVTAVLNGRNNRRIGGRTANTAFFQLFNQRRFAETRWRLGEVLGRHEINQRELIPFVYRRQGSVFITLT